MRLTVTLDHPLDGTIALQRIFNEYVLNTGNVNGLFSLALDELFSRYIAYKLK